MTYLTHLDKIKTAFAIYLHMKDVQVEEQADNSYSIDKDTFYIYLDGNNIWQFQVMEHIYSSNYYDPDVQELITIFVHTSFDKCLIGGIKEYQDAQYGESLASIAEDNYHKLLEADKSLYNYGDPDKDAIHQIILEEDY